VAQRHAQIEQGTLVYMAHQLINLDHSQVGPVLRGRAARSSMGRLTLNVLLSFSQFEREVTGEQIRDKIAASKKGMWMGGNVPLGYDASERTLVVNPAEAETVRRIFALYLDLGVSGLIGAAAY
jgi:DNA invertase Pin-like site-specific DNA recombinase